MIKTFVQEKLIFFPATHQGKLVILIHYSFIMTSIIHASVSISTSYHSLLTKAWFLSINCKYLYKYRSDSVGYIFCSWIRLRVRGTISPGSEPVKKWRKKDLNFCIPSYYWYHFPWSVSASEERLDLDPIII